MLYVFLLFIYRLYFQFYYAGQFTTTLLIYGTIYCKMFSRSDDTVECVKPFLFI